MYGKPYKPYNPNINKNKENGMVWARMDDSDIIRKVLMETIHKKKPIVRPRTRW